MPFATGSVVVATLIVEECVNVLEGGGILDGGFWVVFFVGDLVGSGAFVGFAGRAGMGRTGFVGFGVLFGLVAAVIAIVVFTGIGSLIAVVVVVGFFVRFGSVVVVRGVVDVRWA